MTVSCMQVERQHSVIYIQYTIIYYQGSFPAGTRGNGVPRNTKVRLSFVTLFVNTPRLRPNSQFAIMLYNNQSKLSTVAPVPSVRELGIFVDQNLTMRTHRCQDCFIHNNAASVTLSQQPSSKSSNHLSLLWSSVGWITLMVPWLVSQPTFSIDSGRFRTQRPGSFSGFVASTTSLTLSSAPTAWLRVPERIVFKVAVQTYRVLHGDAPALQCLRQFTSIADIPFRQRLRYSTSDNLLVSAVKFSIVKS